jgi:hypothetical protein
LKLICVHQINYKSSDGFTFTVMMNDNNKYLSYTAIIDVILRSEDMKISLNFDFFFTSWFSCNSRRVLYPVPTSHEKQHKNKHSNYLFIQNSTKSKVLKKQSVSFISNLNH